MGDMQHINNDCLRWIYSTVIKSPKMKSDSGDQTLEQVAQSGCAQETLMTCWRHSTPNLTESWATCSS